jgi:hypothetical protein
MNKIVIVTPCTRPKNLTLIAESIEAVIPRENYRWLVIFDSSKVKKKVECEFAQIHYFEKESSSFGNAQRNYAIDLMQGNDYYKDHYVYFLDDDTILHKNLWCLVKNATEDMVVFEQINKNGKLRLGSDRIMPGLVDTGSAAIKLSAIGKTRFKEHLYEADGYFMSEIARKQITILNINKPASIYNALS